MTLALAPTGAALGDYEQMATHDVSTVCGHTRVRAVDSPTLRDALAHFDTDLTTPIYDRVRLSLASHLKAAVMVGWGSTFLDVVSTIADQTPPLDVSTEPAVGGQDDAVGVVESLARQLGLPVQDVLSGARISKSTFHSWKTATAGRTAPRPRVASQGQLWALAQAVEDMQELLAGDLRGWILADTMRIEWVRRGQLDALLRAVEASPSSAVVGAPAYAAAYGVGGDRSELVETIAPARPRSRTQPAAAPIQHRVTRRPG